MFERVIGRIFPGIVLNSIERRMVSQKTEWKRGKCAASISFDCEYKRDVIALPELINILKSYPFKTSFAWIGRWVAEYPKEHQKVVDDGHEIVNHTYSHPYSEELNMRKFTALSDAEIMEEIVKCDKICQEKLDSKPIGFRTPHFGRQHVERVYPILHRLHYTYSSSTIATYVPSGGIPFRVQKILELPVSPCPKHPWTAFDSYHSITARRHPGEGEFSSLFEELMGIGLRTEGYVNIYFDPTHITKNKDFLNMLDYLEENRKEVWATTMAEVARWCLK